ncbi:hypothetical protein NXT08_14605 [Rhodococcus pyridinivorans]|uniref:hypothetical protein n=1 Tax=Rhodococcus TaxID=1827 RepID=UPI001F2EC1EF|nr:MULTISPECIES: hypothetical protein [Rhodococcus]UPK62066.1 hypothetical protein MYP14_14625 [Rhodococcus pyridinivorans]UVT23563.1 hypothetical protein NXT08_14605 [Rhodococcus pyridinivorans]
MPDTSATEQDVAAVEIADQGVAGDDPGIAEQERTMPAGVLADEFEQFGSEGDGHVYSR